ncbi:MAG: molybdopterin molybdenumtransferase MoeA [Verrucomicrobia bacterium]|nr:MAG: molybdopterin molybdenumtransferase MoeA [Verrucomicrobiota bacterium]
MNGLLVISEKEAHAKILSAVAPLPATRVSLGDALDRFAATDLFATIPLPPFDNSAMDGYAVVAGSAGRNARLKIVGEQPAGPSKNLSLSASEAVRIFTGAPIPTGADAVVMQEETEREGDFVLIRAEQVSAGDFVRKAGADLAIGQQILKRGHRLLPARLGLLASQGIESVSVGRRARVAIVTTGDELAGPRKQPRVGEIFDSNGVMLDALAARTGAQVTMQRHSPDNFDTLCTTLRDAVQHDALIISGGVSVGEHDLVREALREIGAEIDLWRVAVKPGKPFLFGKRDRCLIFGLPGNPVSAFVTFLTFVRPALLQMMGATNAALTLPRASACLTHEVTGDETRPHYFRGELSGTRFTVIGPQESHALFGLARSNALLRVPPGEKLSAGSEVEVLLIR